jgi:hypothetical protein
MQRFLLKEDIITAVVKKRWADDGVHASHVSPRCEHVDGLLRKVNSSEIDVMRSITWRHNGCVDNAVCVGLWRDARAADAQ